jgi:hypothetical protein
MSLKQSPINPATPPPVNEHLADCWRRERDRPCLRIETNSGEIFLFPYHQLHGAHHLRTAEAETLKIFFARNEVVLSGRRLSEIAAALDELAIRWIKSVQSRYLRVAETEGAFVADIEVKAAE